MLRIEIQNDDKCDSCGRIFPKTEITYKIVEGKKWNMCRTCNEAITHAKEKENKTYDCMGREEMH